MIALEHGRNQEIRTMISENWRLFMHWQETTGAYQTLDFPDYVASVFIPRRTLELAENPSRVRALFTERGPTSTSPSSFAVFLYEHLDYPITDIVKYEEHKKAHEGEAVVKLPSSPEEAPPGIDYRHLGLTNLINSGRITFNDKFLLHYYADTIEGFPSVVLTRNLFDRTEMQGKGIGTNFYQRLEDVVRQLGFKYLAGDIISPHPSFFGRRRIRYHDLPAEIKADLSPYFANLNEQRVRGNWMIRIL